MDGCTATAPREKDIGNVGNYIVSEKIIDVEPNSLAVEGLCLTFQKLHTNNKCCIQAIATWGLDWWTYRNGLP